MIKGNQQVQEVDILGTFFSGKEISCLGFRAVHCAPGSVSVRHEAALVMTLNLTALTMTKKK